MTLPYELAKLLKEAGWPQPDGVRPPFGGEYLVHPNSGYIFDTTAEIVATAAYSPSLSELIGGCPKPFALEGDLPKRHFNDWTAIYRQGTEHAIIGSGATPEEAVARLWLELQKNKKIDMASSSHVA